MPIDFNASTLHNHKDAEVQDLLHRIQGNILKGHGRDHTVHIFVRFNSLKDKKLRQTLARFVDKRVTSAWQQHVESDQFKRFQIPGALFGNIFLTKRGYRALGFSDAQLSATFADPFFTDGMAAKVGELNDPPVAQWETGLQSNDIHAMFLFADDDKDFLLRESRVLLNELDAFCEILHVERGEALRDKATNEGIEHFGYVDGRSQPIYLLGDEKDEGKTDKWNPVEPLKIVLTQDKAVAGGKDWGSYFVFRKLEQNVLGFKTKELELADALGFAGSEKERAGAMAVGRFEDGTPLVLSPTPGFLPAKDNNFDYADDDAVDGDPSQPGGLKCPFQAHIRKTNPRGDTVRRFSIPERAERDHRITRRGIPFGKRDKHPNDAQSLADFPTKGVGLLFMCFGSSIEHQFAFMQKDWANKPEFVRGLRPGEINTGIDPVIGQAAAGSSIEPQKWRAAYGEIADGDAEPDVEFDFHGFVKMRGGEFFFAPSMAFLKTFAPPAA